MNTKNNELKVDISPEMQIYRVLQNLSYGIETALAELIDNAIQSYLDGQKLPDKGGLDDRLFIRIDVNDDTIKLSDNASGISRNDIQRALKPGYESNHSAESLSVYGIGMKSAALWFSENWSIKTSVSGENYSLNFNFNLSHLLANKNTTETIIFENEEIDKHYTIITMNNVMRNSSKDYYETVVLPFLLETFVKFKFMDLEIYYNNLKLKPNSNTILLEVPTPFIYPVVKSNGTIVGEIPIEWRIDLNFEFMDKNVKGFMLLMETGSYGQPGIRLLRNNRVIQGTSVFPNIPQELFGNKSKYAAQRVYGEFELNDFPVDFMKTKFNDNLKELFKEINQRLSKCYHYNILKQSTGYRVKLAVLPENKSIVEQMIAKYLPIRADDPNPQPIEIIENESNNFESNLSPEENYHSQPYFNDENNQNENLNNDTNNTIEQDQSPDASSSTSSNDDGTKFEPSVENRIELSQNLFDAFNKFSGDKLPQIYNSLCTISLRKHAVFCYIGAWALLESWSSAMGKNDSTSFTNFLDSRVNGYAIDRGIKNSIKTVLQDIHGKGNCNKHSGTFGSASAHDLKNYFITLEPFIIFTTDKYFDTEASK